MLTDTPPRVPRKPRFDRPDGIPFRLLQKRGGATLTVTVVGVTPAGLHHVNPAENGSSSLHDEEQGGSEEEPLWNRD